MNHYPILQNYLTDGVQQPTVVQSQNDQKLVYLIVPSDSSQTDNLQLKDVQTVPTLLVLPKELQNSANEVQYVIQTSDVSNDHVNYNNTNQDSEITIIEPNVENKPQSDNATDQQYVYVSTDYKESEKNIAKNSAPALENNSKVNLGQKKFYSYKNQYKCEYDGCGELFASVYEKKNHAEVHLFPENTEFKCSICNATFSKAIERNKHIDSHSVAETYRCKSCQKSFPYYTALVKHIDEQKCSTGKSLSCHFCGAKFLNQKDLEKHQKVSIKMCVCKTKVCGESAFISHSGTCSSYLQKKNKLKKGHILRN
ncbi:zinc finger protein 181 isoform X2 [Agrilus planipennis]|nr:zinc finger protein 181 isoform X2 [Agrilus planipennis]